ncbi:phage tail tape measure protein [Pseudomonas sp. 11/12A]|uniref:phage tail tape measure protein n=1 Tax=Pseudomonas sp. 11/12A TaxID=1506582 RepID=UPI00068F4CCD|nr:phage tail tape measure protein [Pseudomonas sp. 11/12A]
MTSIAEIGIRVDSSEAVQATDNLDKMTDAGKRSEDSVKRTGKAWEQAIGGMATNTQQIVKELQNLNAKQDATAQMMAKIGSSISSASSSFQSAAASMGSYRAQNDALVVSQGKAAQSTEKASKAAKQHADDLSALLGKIDPTVAALGRLDDMEKSLSGYKAKGMLDGDSFNEYKAKIDQARAGLTTFDTSLNKTGMSAKATAAALRGVPAQFTDIFTSLQGGQAPMTVLIQQGGQLKDMFGGIGPAAKAMGGYVAGLVNPFTLAAAAAVGLGVAYYKGAEESTRFKTALILTGNAAGTSADSLASMASKVSETVGTTGAAADALAQLAGSGKIASGSFEEVATAALSMEKAAGKAVADTIAEFVKIGKDPVSAAKELNDQYGFLTASVYAQIVSLKEQGREQEAVKLLTDTYADTVQGRSKQVVENLGLWERAWNGVKSAASEALDGIKSVGRDVTLVDQLADAESRLAQLTANGRDAAKEDPFRYAETTKEITRLKLALQASAMDQATAGLRGQNQKDAIAGIDLISKEADGAASNVDKLNKRLEKLGEARTKNIANNSWGDDEQAKYEKATSALKKQIADDQKKATKTSASAVDLSGFNDAQNKLKLITSEYDNAQQKLNAAQKSGLLSQKDYSEQSAALVEQEKGRITAAYQAEIDALEAAKGKKSTSAEQRIALDQKIADARTNMVKAQQDADTQLNVLSTNEEGRLNKQAAAVQTYIDALDDQLATTKKQLALSVSGVGMGDEARKRLQEDIKIQQEYQDKLDKLLAQKNKNQIDEGVYQQETAAVREALSQRLAMQKEYYGAVEAEQTNWLNGASSAYATYLEQVKDVAGQTKSAFTSAFKSLEDVLVSFATTGKASFKDFADSIIADFARIAIKSKVMPAILGAVGLSGSDQAAGGGSGSGSGANGMLGLASGATKLYSFASSGLGSAVSSGWSAGNGVVGGIEGAFKAGSTYVSDSITSAFANTSVGLSSQASASLAAGSSQAGYASIGAGSEAAASMAAGASQAGYGASAGASAGTSAAAAGLTATGAVTYGIGGAISGYLQAGVKGAVAGAGGAVAGAYAGAAIGSVVPVIGTAIGAAIGAVIGGTIGGSIFGGDWQTKDQGLSLGVEGGDFAGQKYEYQKKKGGLFGKNKKRTRLSALDPEMQAALDNTYDATENSVLTLFDRLNVKLNDGVLDGLNVASTQISTKDKTAEQIQEEIAKWFGGVADSMVTAVDSAVGSGLGGRTFEGLTTFVNNLYSVNDVLENLNVDLYDFSVSGGLLAERLSAMAGGLESLTKNAGTYYENFFSDTEKADDTLAAVGKQFAALGLALPDTRDAYRGVIEALDMTTTAGQQMFVTMTGLAGNASQAYTILEQRATQAAQAIADALMGAVTGSNGALQRAIAAEQKNVTAAYNARVTSLNDMASTASKNVSDLTGVSNSLGSALKQLRGDSDETVKALRNQAQATLQSALSKARAGGSLAEFAGLSDALDTLGSNNTDLYRSMEDFQRDQGRTANEVAELNKLNGKQLTTAEQTVKTLDDQLEQAKASYEAQMAQFDSQLAFAQAQMDALNGIDNSVKSVADAISAMNQSVIAALSVTGGKGTTNTPTNNGAYIDTIYKELLGRKDGADAAGKDYWLGELANGHIGLDQLTQAIANAARENKEKVKAGYATGGLISGPGTGTSDSIVARLSNGEYVLTADAVRTYGTDLLDKMNAGNLPKFASGGPVVRNYSASQTAAMLSGPGDSAETIAELRQLRADIHNDLAFLTKHMEKTAYNTTQINESGVQVVNTVKTEAA